MKRPLVLWLLICLTFHLNAQNFSKQNVLKLNLRSTGPLMQDDQVKGYYFFYKVEKKDPKNDNYLLGLYDENLREINTLNIVRPKKYVLVDGVYNGSAFGFLFYDARTKTTELVSYDKSLNQIGQVKKKVKNKHTIQAYSLLTQGAEPNQAYLKGVPNKGFIHYGMKDGSKPQYAITHYDNKLNTIWKHEADGKTSVEVASEGFQTKDFVGSAITRKRNLTTKDIDSDLLVHEASSGKLLFRKNMATEKYSLSFSDVSFDSISQTFVVFGEYNDKRDKELKAASLGFMTLTLDMNGNTISEKTNSWATEISRLAPVNERGKFDGNNARILFHEFVRTADGKIFAIGEQYKKVASAGGIIGNVLFAGIGGNGATFSNAELNIYNMVVFEFASDYTLNRVHVIEKSKNVAPLPVGSEYSSPKYMAFFAKSNGSFDYAFTQRSSDKKVFFSSYVNYDRKQTEKGKNVLGTIVYTPEGQLVVDKVNVSRKSNMFLVQPGKEGYVMVIEYFKKEKRMDTRLEKINY